MSEGTGRPPPPRADHRLERSRTRSEEASDIRLGLRRPRQVTSGGASSQRRPPRLRRGRGSYWNRRTAPCPHGHGPLGPARTGIRSGKHRCGPVTLITLPSPGRRTESIPLLRGLRALDVPDSHDHSASSCDGGSPDRRTHTARRAGLSGTMSLISRTAGPYLIV